MSQDMIEIRRHEADAIQADAELAKLEAVSQKNDAKKRLDEELGISAKRAEFRRRLDNLRKATKSEYQDLLAAYKKDWSAFKADVSRRYEKQARIGNAEADLLEARLDGLAARIEYLVGLAVQDNADEARAIQKSLEPTIQEFESLGADFRAAFDKQIAQSKEDMADYDKLLQDDTRRAKAAATEKEQRH